jgi:hypothetical protein
VLAVVLGSCQLATAASPNHTVALHAALIPEHLGQGTTLKFAFTITPPTGQLPPALHTVALRYPENLGIATSGLGVSTCRASLLEANGPIGLSRRLSDGLRPRHRGGPIRLPNPLRAGPRHNLHGATTNHHLQLLFYADGERPVSAQLVFPATVLSAPPPFGGNLQTTLPLIPSLPEAPDVALVKLQTTIGPSHITYYEYAKHKTIPYHPNGILLPRKCPHGGFQFAVEMTFITGTQSNAHTAVLCPTPSTVRR